MSIPVIETERLRLRPHTAGDLDACAAMWREPAVIRYIGGKAATDQETWFKLLRYAGMWALLGYGYWAVEAKESGEFVGEVGFADFMRGIDPGLNDSPELGWVLATRAHGRGLGTEAVRAALAWSDANLECRRSVCLITSGNLASVRVAEKCGYRESHRVRLGGDETTVYFRNRGGSG